MFATRSAKELPIANIVNPMMASESPKMIPKAWKTIVRREDYAEKERTYLEHVDHFICNRHDPHDRNQKTHGTPYHLGTGMCTISAYDDNERTNRGATHECPYK